MQKITKRALLYGTNILAGFQTNQGSRSFFLKGLIKPRLIALKLLLTALLLLSIASCAIFDQFRRTSNDTSQAHSNQASVVVEEGRQPEVKPSQPWAPEIEVSSALLDDLSRAAEPDIKPDTGATEIAHEVESNDEAGIGLIAMANPVTELCEEVGTKLGSVTIEDCLSQRLVHATFTSRQRSLAFKDYQPLANREPLGRVLVIGGIHGNEFSSVSVIMKWMKILDQFHSGLFHWRFVPAANPDGLLSSESQRQNHNGVDLNRNFPTADWNDLALAHWEHETHRNPRRHPGHAQASELETQWLVKQIEEFNPDVIISMHAPYHLVDYDGPPSAPEMLGGLYLRPLGVFPGSLGNYAGIDLQLPIVTVELKSAGIMPARREIDRMWNDLVRWLREQLSR